MSQFGIPASAIPDLLTAVVDKIDETELEQEVELPESPFVEVLASGTPQTKGGSVGFRYDLQQGSRGSTRGFGMYGLDNFEVRSVGLTDLVCPWAYRTDNISYEVNAMAQATDDAEVVEQLEAQIRDMRIRWFESLERWLSGVTPVANLTDTQNFRGVSYYLRALAAGTASAGGRNGQTYDFSDGTTTTLNDNVDRALVGNDRVRNWVGTYDASNMNELQRRLMLAMHETSFRVPGSAGSLKLNPAQSHTLFMAPSAYDAMLEYINSGSDDRNGNAVPFSNALKVGMATMRRCPVLADVAFAPVYGVKSSYFGWKSLPGRWGVDSTWREGTNRHTTMFRPRDWVGNFYCKSPRTGGFVLHTVR
jgi:hypothetical protein